MKNLALMMLCYNGENLIERSLRSVLPYVSEANIIDTGSTDGTVAIIERLKEEFPQIDLEVRNIHSMGKAWVDKEKNTVLTEFLNYLMLKTQADWILKVDDDEVFPQDLMEEIIALEPTEKMYTISFYHIEGDHVLDTGCHRNLRAIRLFENDTRIDWRGDYGLECVSFNGKRIPTRKCKGLYHRFLHLGELRTGLWKHDYRFHEVGHCRMELPEEYKHYVFG